MATEVTSILFKDYVNDGAVPADNFVPSNGSVHPDHLKEGEVLVQLLYLSVDPYMRMQMKDAKSYRAGFQPGQPIESRCVGQVVASTSERWEKGDVVAGMMPWSSHVVLDRKGQAHLQLVPKKLLGKLPLSNFIGALGMPGMTAYASLKKIAEPQKGEVAFVTAASGAVGLVVGQLLKNVYGCTVIGSAGSDDKVALLQEVGFDHAFNYKTTDTAAALAAAAPDGIDIYFENVGGETLDIVLNAARPHARIVACGMISQYDLPPEKRYGIKNLFQIIGKRIKIQGFIVGDYAAELGMEFAENMAQYILEGKVKPIEHITEGLTNAGTAFVEMMKGGNVGKAVVKVCGEDPFPAAAAQ
jgi:hypothetical protein